MINYDEYIDDDFVDYEMRLHKIRGNEFTFRLILSERVKYGNYNHVKKFICFESIFYLRHRYPNLKGTIVTVRISRLYKSKYSMFEKFHFIL